MAYSTQPKMWFWFVAILFFLWNLMGLGALSSEYFAPDMVTSLMNDAQLELYNSRPSWYMYVYAVAVFAGLFTCIALLFKRKVAVVLSLISLFMILISTGYNLTTNAWNIVNAADRFFFVAVPVFAVLLWLFARSVHQKGWLK